MAGQVYGKIECVSSNTGSKYNTYEMFKGLYDFLVYLETQGVVTLRARYAGVGASVSTNVGYWDEAYPFNHNAWALFEWRTGSTTPDNPSYAGTRTEPFYIFIQFATRPDGGFSQSVEPSAPALICGATTTDSGNSGAVGIQMAVGKGGDQIPWNGTLGTYGSPSSFGSQSKAWPVWKIPTGGDGLYVFPRSNNSGGAHNTDKQNLNYLLTTSSTPFLTRYHFIADHDGLLVLSDDTNDVNYHYLYTGVYQLRDGLTTADPYLMMGGKTIAAPGAGFTFGDAAGTAVDNGGIAFNTYGTNLVQQMKVSLLQEVLGLSSNLTQPNQLFASSTYDEMPYLIQPWETYAGFAGSLEFFRVVQNVANLERNTAGSKLIIGTPAVSALKFIVPWNSTVVPLSGNTREGTTGLGSNRSFLDRK
jgi:hypothetical protein